MVGPASFLRALTGASGAVAIGAVLAAAPLPALGAAPAAAATAGPVAAVGTGRGATSHPVDPYPLQVRIEDLAPAYLPSKGTITVRGSVTNASDETWTTIKLYAVDGTGLPAMRTSAQLSAAAASPYDTNVGNRVTDRGTPGSVLQLDPGQTSTFRVVVPASALHPTQGGVYWFGVQALGQSGSSPRDAVSDGRARTFLPYVPPRVRDPLPTALVVPLVRDVPYAEDGSLDLVPRWTRSLGQDGRVKGLLDFAQTAGGAPLTWLVDPALVDAVARLADGNPARSLAPDRAGPGASSTPSAGQTASPGASASPGTAERPVVPDAQRDPETRAAAAAATDWLTELGKVVAGQQVLTLPYGDLDVAAAVHLDPALLATARRTTSTELTARGVDTSPAIASPTGYLDAATIVAGSLDAPPSGAPGPSGSQVPQGAQGSQPIGAGRTTVIGSDKMFPGRAPALADVAGHPLVVASSGAAEGGPGPGPALSAAALRQRILSEAAVRVLRHDRQPLVVVLPTEWDLQDGESFFTGLQDTPWLGLRDLSSVVVGATPTPVDPARLVYPPRQERRELDAPTIEAASALVHDGTTLQSMLTRNTSVSGEVTRQALSGASYDARTHQLAARTSLERARAWVDDRLGAVKIAAPRGVTLSGASGKFAATLTNPLDEPVTVGVVARSDAGISISQPRQVQLAARSHTTVILEAQASNNKVHNVTLMVTDGDGTPLGASQQLPIRSAQVSAVIWLIIGTGGVLLFGAIAVQLYRRITGARPLRRAG